jgi:hypothetical protein
MVIGELGGVLKEAVVVYWWYFPGIYLTELRKATENVTIAGVPTEIRTQYLQSKRFSATADRSTVSLVVALRVMTFYFYPQFNSIIIKYNILHIYVS